MFPIRSRRSSISSGGAVRRGREPAAGGGARARLLRGAVLAPVALATCALWAAVSASAAGSAGTLYAFGSNTGQQLGNSVNSSPNQSLCWAPNPSPVAVTLPGEAGTVTDAAAGAAFSLAVTSTGQLYAFGASDAGTSASPSPVSLPGEVGPVRSVAAGDDSSLVVTASGQLYAFGDNEYGELGIATDSGTTTPVSTPTLVTLPGEVGGVTAVAEGGNFSLVATSGGQLYAFGDNEFGQLGSTTDNGVVDPPPLATPTLVTLPGQSGPVTRVAAGLDFSVVLTATGQLYAFGDNGEGQLGLASSAGFTGSEPNIEPTPTQITLPGAVGIATEIAAGWDHTLVVTASGQLYAFGGNESGQLGNDVNTGVDIADGDEVVPNPTPTTVSLPGQVGGVTQVSAGDEFSTAVTAGGQLYAFGNNQMGELGNATNAVGYCRETPPPWTTPNPTPTLVSFAAGTTIDAVADGPFAQHTLALVSDLAIASGTLASGQVGSPYSGSVTASGGVAPITWSASGLPPGLAIDATTGALTGTPAQAGTFTPTVTATDADGGQASATLSLAVAAAPPAGGLSEPNPVPVEVSAPVIAGSATDGRTLTAGLGSWSNDPTRVSYQWEDCSAASGVCTPITGATGQTYTLTAADVGATIRVVEIAQNAAGPSSPIASPPSAVVQAAARALPAAKVLSGAIDSKAGRATFHFKGSAGATGFECALVRVPAHGGRAAPRPAYAACGKSKTFRRLAPGRYVLYVRAVGPTGTQASPVTYRFRVAG